MYRGKVVTDPFRVSRQRDTHPVQNKLAEWRPKRQGAPERILSQRASCRPGGRFLEPDGIETGLAPQLSSNLTSAPLPGRSKRIFESSTATTGPSSAEEMAGALPPGVLNRFSPTLDQ
jgi:hypothetical protein